MTSRPSTSAMGDNHAKGATRNYMVGSAMTTEEESRETAVSDSEFERDRSASPIKKISRRTGAGSAASKQKRVGSSPKLTETEDHISEGTVAGSDSREKLMRKKKQKKIPQLDQLVLELKQLDTVDLTLKHKEATDIIEMVATTSNNLKGTFVKKLKVAARTADLIEEELHKRCISSASMRPPAPAEPTTSKATQEKEITALRAEVLNLQEELARERRKAAGTSSRTETRATESLEDSILDKVARLIDNKLAAAGIGDSRSTSTSGKGTKAAPTKTHQGVGGPIGEVARRAVSPRSTKKKMAAAAETARAADAKTNKINNRGVETAVNKKNAAHLRPLEPTGR